MKKKNSRQARSAHKVAVAKHNGPGRPKYQPVFPRTNEWTFTDWMEANEIDTRVEVNGKPNKNFGKGPHCTMLTLRKHMKRDMWICDKKGKKLRRNPHSVMVQVDGVSAEPNSKSGLGRRADVFCLRAKMGGKKASASRKAAVEDNSETKAPETDLSQATQSYEEMKAILAAPSAPAPEAPVVTEMEPAHIVPAAVTMPAVTFTPSQIVNPVLAATAPEAPAAVETPSEAPESQPATAEAPAATETAPVAA